MVADARVLQAIYEAVDEINQQLSEESRMAPSLDTVLLGEAAQLSSMELVNLILAAEQNVEEKTGVMLTIADEKAMSLKQSPFRTIGTLADYVTGLLEERPEE